MKKSFFCLVCGFEGLKESPCDKNPTYEICACCGFESGFDDRHDNKNKYKTYREKWIGNGAKWFMPELRPKTWQLDKQLNNISQNKNK